MDPNIIDTPIFFVTDTEVLNVREIITAEVITGEDCPHYDDSKHEGLKFPCIVIGLKDGEWFIEYPHSLEFMAFMKSIAANRT